MTFLKMTDIHLANQRVLIREDLNVPIEKGNIASDARIQASLPTIRRALENKAAVMIVSHLGRPQEGVYAEEFSLAPVAKRLSELLDRPIPLIANWIDGVKIQPGEAVLCENVRFLVGEKSNDDALSRKMAALCDVYVNDAFATSHRKEASMHGVAKYAKIACAGLLVTAELEALGSIMKAPKKPLAAIVGGAKVSSKLLVLKSIANIVDYLIIGGGIANTFLAAAGYPIGKSLYEPELVNEAKALLEKTKSTSLKIPLPEDVVVADKFSAEAKTRIASVSDVKPNELIVDLGPKTIDNFIAILDSVNTILWNGPMGAFEMAPFSQGTERLAKAIAESKAYSVAGGGDTIAAIEKFAVAKEISYISTAGGAFLEYLEGKTLPAIAILEERAKG